MNASGPSQDPWSPLRHRIFMALWIAAMASNVGTWVQNVGEKWLMSQLTPSPLLMSLIETGTTLPMLALSMPGGAIADIVDRRRLLLLTQSWMLLVAGAMAVLSAMHILSPAILIGMSLLLGLGAALNAPAWGAIIPELVAREEIAAGVALNSAGFNVSRAVGPALGGLVVGWLGPSWAFFLNALSFLGVVAVLRGWKRPVATTDLPAERFAAAMKVGLRYTRHRRALQVILLRCGGFVFCAGIVFGLLPSLAFHQLHLGSAAFGLLLGCIGAGAVGGTLALPRIRARLNANAQLALFTTLFAGALLVLAHLHHAPSVALALIFCGFSWLSVLSTFNTGVQLSVPSWVKARALGVYITVWGGAMAVGAAFWGWVGERWGLSAAFTGSAFGLMAGLLATGRMKVMALHEELDLSPARAYPHPPEPIAMEEGPILTVLEYRIPPDKGQSFRDAMRDVRHIRIRDGAVRWSLFHDRGHPAPQELRFIESFLSSSWGEHLRQHHRATMEDREVLSRAYTLDPEGRPRTRHLVAAWEEEGTFLDRILE